MPAVLFLMLHSTIALGSGWMIISRLDIKNQLGHYERLLFSFLTGYGVIYYAVFAVGIFRLDVFSMSAVMFGLGVIAVVGLRAMPWSKIVSLAFGEIRKSSGNYWRIVLMILISVISVTSLLQGLAPPNDYDSLMYHISFPQYDVEIGRISVPWDRSLAHTFFPALMGNQSRLALTLSSAGAAQMVHGVLGIACAFAISLLMRRLGYRIVTALLAAVIFLSIRVVVWEMGSVEVDVPLAAFSVSAVLVYVIYRHSEEPGLGLLFGISVGLGILTKFHGFAIALSFGLVIVFDIVRKNKSVLLSAVGPLTAFALYLPHAIRSWVMTGNPIYPLFNHLFNPDGPKFFSTTPDAYGLGKGLLDVILTPWFIFIKPMHFFDGMIFGTPILLALAPIMLLDIKQIRRWLIPGSVAIVYYIIWFYNMGHTARFLLPLMPIFAGMAAAGAATMWESTHNFKTIRYAFAIVVLVLVVGQGLFVGIYSAIRLPVSIGLTRPLDYHRYTPTLQGASYETCSYISQNLASPERYMSLVFPLSFYCPQGPVVVNYFEDEARWWLTKTQAPEMSLENLIGRLEKTKFKYFLLPKGFENRRNVTGKSQFIPVTPNSFRFAKYFLPAIQKLKPLSVGRFTLVYEGEKVLHELQQLLSSHQNNKLPEKK